MFVRRISSESEYFVTKPGMLMQYHEPKCYAEKPECGMGYCVSGQGHSQGARCL